MKSNHLNPFCNLMIESSDSFDALIQYCDCLRGLQGILEDVNQQSTRPSTDMVVHTSIPGYSLRESSILKIQAKR